MAAGVQLVGKPRTRLGKRLAPYLLIFPGGLWLLIFFLIPIVFMLSVSLQTGNLEEGFQQTWHFHRYVEVFQQYRPQFVRSFAFGTIATAVTLVVAYPLAYWIAFHGGRHKTTFLFMLLLPFFVSFVIRTLAWQFILSDDGLVFGTLKNWHLLPQNFHVLATRTAVISGGRWWRRRGTCTRTSVTCSFGSSSLCRSLACSRGSSSRSCRPSAIM